MFINKQKLIKILITNFGCILSQKIIAIKKFQLWPTGTYCKTKMLLTS